MREGGAHTTVLLGVLQRTLFLPSPWWGGRPFYPRITSGSWVEWSFLTVKGCQGDDRRHAIFRGVHVQRNAVILSTK
ncbi:hypothetical protein TNCV_961281 [Trichonephila clavipes]|uniref:Uncharacterized protein n=1 Tax=Trichonephila clavipes TaxID=2585209 RepID=A0A8X6SEA7_TRICX|nr:hypothetical protein TNCV_961281 [Trichonephila clavipes]